MSFNTKGIGAIIITFLAIILFACSQKKDKTVHHTHNSKLHNPDTLAFSWNGFSKYEKNCSDSNNCSYVTIMYPVFKSAPKLNRYITAQILDYLNTDNTKAINLDTAFKNFADDFLAADSDSTDMKPISTLELYFDIFREDSRIIVIKHEEDMSGGAHPNEGISYINWDEQLDSKIELKDILVENYDTQLTKIAEKIFRNDEKLTPTQSLDSYFFKDGVFELNDNFQIMPKGLNFFYNNYEIKPYSEGPTDLFIPYTKIKHLLRPGTVVSQYIK